LAGDFPGSTLGICGSPSGRCVRLTPYCCFNPPLRVDLRYNTASVFARFTEDISFLWVLAYTAH